MTETTLTQDATVILERAHFQQLLDALLQSGYRVIGPTIEDRAIVYESLSSVEDLPIGWKDQQEGGTFRLEKRKDQALFGYTLGPQTWKKHLYPPNVTLWQAKRENGSFKITPPEEDRQPLAFIGVRACELSAIAIQDKIFLESEFKDPIYQQNREGLFIVAVNCVEAGGTCFCASMETGPKASTGFDLALTEVIDGEKHYFVVNIGSARGLDVIKAITVRTPEAGEVEAAEARIAEASQNMGRTLETEGLRDLLFRNIENPRWEAVADRCLTCGNCTLVCPTCFCATIEDVTDLTGQHAERTRRWDSCFTMDFSYIHGGSVRYSSRARYRQWMMHKLASWVDQFGTFGCVGCGRCITWCPVAIDITEEANIIRQGDVAKTKEA
ncbi:MAG: sulfite reductase subunit A [Chloroflexi bacterium]|nr:sulfite reductase subunit A [Chloroflexota bacterium]